MENELKRGEDEQVERAFQMLEINGVPRARAKTVGNGIDVLATRFGKEIATLTAELEREKTNFPMLKRRIATLTEAMATAPEHRELIAEIDENLSCRTRDWTYELLTRCRTALENARVEATPKTCDHWFAEHIAGQIKGPVRCGTCEAVIVYPVESAPKAEPKAND